MQIPLSIGTDIFSVTALLFTIFLAKKNSLVNGVKTKYYLRSAFVVCLILIFEMLDVILANADYRFRIAHILVNVIAFSLSPIVPICITILHSEKVLEFKRYLYIPFFVIVILSITTWKTGLIFYIDENNVYSRGTYFWIYPAIMFFYFFVLICSDYENYKKYEKDEKHFLYSLYVIILIGTILQLAFPKWLFIWTSISMSLLLYYIFLRELQFKHDPMTEIYNRSVFQKELLRINTISGVGIIVVDINNLKLANDQYGHGIGDEMIIKVAHTINDCFYSNGKVYRIGGDEFCVICEQASDEKISGLLYKLDTMIQRVNEDFVIDISIAYGYCIFSSVTMKDSYEAFSIADQRMYLNKALFKVQEANHENKNEL